MRVLIVDDDAATRDLLARSFSREGYTALLADSCATARALIASEHVGLIVLDVMLPDGSGTDLCRALRADGLSTPVLLLTARGAVGDRVAGLDAGADDYLAKPFAISELLARARALTRRGPALRDEVVRFGAATVDFGRRRVVVDDTRVLMTPQELAVLEVLVSRRTRVVSREHLIEAVWGTSSPAAGNSLEVLIARIRRKLGDAAALLRTVRGVGYALGED